MEEDEFLIGIQAKTTGDELTRLENAERQYATGAHLLNDRLRPNASRIAKATRRDCGGHFGRVSCYYNKERPGARRSCARRAPGPLSAVETTRDDKAAPRPARVVDCSFDDTCGRVLLRRGESRVSLLPHTAPGPPPRPQCGRNVLTSATARLARLRVRCGPIWGRFAPSPPTNRQS